MRWNTPVSSNWPDLLAIMAAADEAGIFDLSVALEARAIPVECAAPAAGNDPATAANIYAHPASGRRADGPLWIWKTST